MIFKSANIDEVFHFVREYWKPARWYIIEIKPLRQVRSLSQNRYYWGVVLKIIAEYCGYSDDTIHEMLKEKFLIEYVPIKCKTGTNMQKTCQRTSELTTERFESYLIKCRMWAKDELNIDIPLPGDVTNEGWMQIQNKYDQMTY